MSNPAAVGDNFRRTWDESEYEEKARARMTIDRAIVSGLPADVAANPKADPTPKASLKERTYEVDLDSMLGKTQVVNRAGPESQSGGYYCNVCDCVVKDSINFLDHINGRKHQRNMGMSMKVKRASVDEVKKRFELNKVKREEENKEKEYNFEERMRELEKKEQRRKMLKKEKRKAGKRKAEEATRSLEAHADSDLSAVMGFSGFGK